MVYEQPGYRFELYDPDANDVARALAARLGENVAASPARVRTARRIPRPVVVHATDTDTTATLACERDRATVYNDLAGRPGIIVRADTDRLREIWRLPLTAGPAAVGAPVPGTEPARGVVGELLGRRIRVTGLLRHPLTARWVLSLLAPVG